MSATKINRKNLKDRCRRKNLTVTALAKMINRSRPSVYFAAENPGRYPFVYSAIMEVLS